MTFSGCERTSTDFDVLTCLREKDAMLFAEHTKHFLHYPWVGPNVWKPYFDGNNVSRPLFRDWPENLLESGQYNKVPVIIGVNSDEGALNVVGFLRGRANFQVLSLYTVSDFRFFTLIKFFEISKKQSNLTDLTFA